MQSGHQLSSPTPSNIKNSYYHKILQKTIDNPTEVTKQLALDTYDFQTTGAVKDPSIAIDIPEWEKLRWGVYNKAK